MSSASTLVASGRMSYLPRPMNSDRTFCVSVVSRLNTRGSVGERRNPDRLDGRRQKRAAAGERVAAAAVQPTPHRTHSDTKNRRRQPSHCTTTDTSGPFATTTLRIVLPAMCVRPRRRRAPARAARRRSRRPATVSRARTLPLICTGTTTSSALATSASNAGQAARREAVGMAEHLPELLGRVRRERRHHHDERVERLAQRPPASAARSTGAGRRLAAATGCRAACLSLNA